jgi:hypothetical protein
MASAPLQPPLQAQAPGRPSFTYGLADNMRRFGQEHRPTRWQIDYLTRLIATEGFPAPLPLPAGEGLTHEVKPRSRWQQDSVDRWFDDRTPPGTSDAVDRQAARAAGDVMDARAAAFAPLRLVGGTQA